MLIGMPDIPDFKGVVSAAESVGVSFGGAALLNAVFGKVWGVTNEFGIPVLAVDSIKGVTYDAGNTISNLPVEGGSFASYNKVDNPSMATVIMSKGSGGTLGRGAFLSQIEILRKSTLSFNIITPEFVYMGYQMIGTSLTRSQQQGTTLLEVNVDLQEMREAKVTYSFEEVEQPSDATSKDGGGREAKNEQNNSVLFEKLGGLFGR